MPSSSSSSVVKSHVKLLFSFLRESRLNNGLTFVLKLASQKLYVALLRRYSESRIERSSIMKREAFNALVMFSLAAISMVCGITHLKHLALEYISQDQ